MENNCSQVNGNRYILNGDRAVMLLFNENGNIAGISAGIPKNSKKLTDLNFWYNSIHISDDFIGFF